MKAKKVDPIILTDKETNKKYTLEFSRESVVFAEKQGFNASNLENGAVLSTLYDLWFYSFRMHHKYATHEVTDGLLDKLLAGGGKGIVASVFGRLSDLFLAPYLALQDDENDEDGGDEGNALVTVEL